MMIGYPVLLSFWLLNWFMGNNGGFLHRVFVWTFKLSIVVPGYVIYKSNSVNESYGDDDQVAASSAVGGDAEYLITKTDDSHYSAAFLLTYLLSVLQIVTYLVAWPKITGHYSMA